MNMCWLVGAVLAIGVAPGLACAEEVPAAEGSARPVAGLVCIEPVFDFGEKASGSTVTNTFVLRNDGTNAVSIVNVRPTCGCTTVGGLSTNRLVPGATASLSAALSLAGRRGPQHKPIYVETDDPAQPRLHLVIKGLAAYDIMVRPEGASFGMLSREGPAQKDVLLTANSNVAFTIKSVSTSSTQFTAEAETREPGTSYWIRIRSSGPRSPGAATAMIQVATDLPSTPTITIPVSVFVGGDVVAVPSQMVLVPSATNEPRPAHLMVYAPSGKAFTVQSVEWPSPSVTGTVFAAADGRVRIEVRSQGGLEDVEGKSIRILTDVDTARELLVPVRVVRLPVRSRGDRRVR